MSDDSYSDILTRARNTIPAPIDIPSGTWLIEAVSGKYTTDPKETKKGVPSAGGTITFKPIEAGDDVDEEAFNEFAAESLAGARIFHNYWLYDLRDSNELNNLLDKLGLNGDLSFAEAMKEIKGYRVMGYVYSSYNEDDPERPFINVKQFAPVED